MNKESCEAQMYGSEHLGRTSQSLSARNAGKLMTLPHLFIVHSNFLKFGLCDSCVKHDVS